MTRYIWRIIAICILSIILPEIVFAQQGRRLSKIDGDLDALYRSVYERTKDIIHYKVGGEIDHIEHSPDPICFRSTIPYEIVKGEYFADLLIKTNGDYSGLRTIGVDVHTIIGNICTARCSLSLIPSIDSLPSVSFVEPSRPAFISGIDDYEESFLDLSTKAIGVDTVRSNLQLWGDGVIIGIIDDGIDVTHQDFKNASKTTILKYWYQDEIDDTTQSHPFGFNYGALYDSAFINSKPDSVQPWDKNLVWHGTWVASIAAGRGGSVWKYRGIAPNADLVVVGGLEENITQKRILDGLEFIRQVAWEYQKPYVINISLSAGHSCTHDGYCNYEQALSDFLSINGGNVPTGCKGIVLAAGNDTYDGTITTATSVGNQNKRIHTRKTGTDSFMVHIDGCGAWDCPDFVRTEIYYKKSDSFKVCVYPPDTTVAFAYNLWPGNIFSDVNEKYGYLFVNNELYDSSSLWNRVTIIIGDDTTSNPHIIYKSGNWKIKMIEMISQSTTWDGYLTSQIHHPYLVNAITTVDYDPFYAIPCGGNSRNVITVGSFDTKCSWVDAGGNSQGNCSDIHVGEMSYFSGLGPSRTEVEKPELLAPGAMIVGSKSSGITPDYAAYNIDDLHHIGSGTSAAAPHVTGGIALMAEYDLNTDSLNWDYREIRSRLINGARMDYDNTYPTIFCHFVNIYRALMLNASGEPLPIALSLSQNYPNPFNPETHIKYSVPDISKQGQEVVTTLEIFNILGQRVRVLVSGPQPPGWHHATWDSRDDKGQTVAAGVYLYRCTSGDFSETKKMVLVK